MGKASKWFRGLLGLKTSANPDPSKPPAKKKWSFAKRDRQKPHHPYDVAPAGESGDDARRHAISVAAATAAAAEAAAAVVQLTRSGRSISPPVSGGDVRCTAASVSRSGGGYRSHRSHEEWAAVMIQSHFRAYLSRRALRALKGLVKLQALVRGHQVRKQTAYTLKRLQALVRAQVRARAGRVLVSEPPHSAVKSYHFNHPVPATPEKFEHSVAVQARSMKHQQLILLKRKGSKSSSSVNFDPEKAGANTIWTDSRKGERLSDQEYSTRLLPTDKDRSGKILEVDTGKPCVISKQRMLFYSSHLSLGSDQNCQSISTSKDSTAPCQSVSLSEVQSLSSMQFAQDADETAFCTADNSPTFYSSSSRGGSTKRGAFTPAKSECARSCANSYSAHPNYMSYTESSKAKVRSQSAPRQRPQYERVLALQRDIQFTHTVIQDLCRKVHPCSITSPMEFTQDLVF